VIDLTLNSFMIGNMPSFDNAFGTKQSEPGKGCSTAEITRNMMLPFLRMRPITVTSDTETSAVEADAVLHLAGSVTSLRLGNGDYHGVELTIYNGTADAVELLDQNYTIALEAGDTREFRWNGTDWRVKHDYHVGDYLTQMPNERSPVDKRLEGTWKIANDDTAFVGISSTPPTQQFIADRLTHLVDIWNLNTDGTVATQGTKKYAKPGDYVVVPRCKVLKITDENLSEGEQVAFGQYAGMYVWENQTLAGLFMSVAGGNRPPYGSGTAGDMSREVRGNYGRVLLSSNAGAPNGPFTATVSGTSGGSTGTSLYQGEFIISRVVPTGPEFAPVTFTGNAWRRVA